VDSPYRLIDFLLKCSLNNEIFLTISLSWLVSCSFISFNSPLNSLILFSDEISSSFIEISGLEENPGTGGKKGEIIAFDLAYIEFAEQLNIQQLLMPAF
jgi:hypothetical protein